MNTPTPDSHQNVCPKCGRPIAEGSPRGLCPLCLISEVEKDDSPQAQVPAPELDELRRAFPTLEIIEPLGAGGMGRVYKVRQPNLDRFGALKLLPPGLTEDPAWVERFTREARALARLNHPGIVQVYDFGEASSTSDQGITKKFPFLLMEFVDGVNLRQALRSGTLTAGEALAIVPPICAALQYAHDQGVLHRDIKPENILLDAEGRIKIADFGVAKLAGAAGAPGATLTATGAQLGTAAYMAPEQIERPQDVDHRADIFSLGVVFYELLTGELPLGRFLAPSEKAGTDPRLDTIVFRTLEKERERRFQTAAEVKSEVEHVTSSQPPPMPVANASASAPAEPVTPRNRVALVLSLVILPFLLLGLVLILPLGARAGVSWAGSILGAFGVMVLAAVLTVVGFTWLFRRLQRSGVSTAMAVVLVGLGLIILPPVGCVGMLMVPAYMSHRTRSVVAIKEEFEIRRDSTVSTSNKLAVHWRITSRQLKWITIDFRGAKRMLELHPDGTGQYTAEIDAEILVDSTRTVSRLHLMLGNGKDKTAGEFRFLEPAEGWLARALYNSAPDGIYEMGRIMLAQIGTDPLSLTVSHVEPPKAEGLVNFTVKSVSVYEADGATMLSLQYMDEVAGDAELYFKTEGMDESPTPLDTVKPVSDRMELWKHRFWRMPVGMDEKVRQELKSTIESQYLNKTIEVPAGHVSPFFDAKLPDGTTAHVTMGVRDGKR
jgi:hypothetical protein